MKKQCMNPYLPSWEYIPDGEPYVFDGRVYVYGSHDKFNGYAYCLGDYVCWSAPEDDLSDWRYEGVIYKKDVDPRNRDGDMCLFAPDVTRGSDGKYYLFYVLNRLQIVSVAVCDTPAGEYKFHGYVKYPDGTLLGEREGDMPQFDPGVHTEGDKTYLYTGFCSSDDKSRKGPIGVSLREDMLTIIDEPRFMMPSKPYAMGSGYEGHEFFEAPSMRKIGDNYYLIYSSVVCHELCYAMSKSPLDGFQYKGVIISNNDTGIDSYKPADKPMYYGGNNHGSIVEIAGQWYIFYHRHTNGTNYSRQGCTERININADGTIDQVMMTSQGASEKPLRGEGVYPAYSACALYCSTENAYSGGPDDWHDSRFPKITQDGADGDKIPAHIANMRDGAVAGFKFFDCKGINRVKITIRGGYNGVMEVLTSWDGDVIGEIPIGSTNEWASYENDIKIPDGINSLYFRRRGPTPISFLSFELLK